MLSLGVGGFRAGQPGALALKNILLDTSAYSAFKRGDPEPIEILRRAETIGISSVVLGELLCGFAAVAREADNRRA